MKLGRNNVPWYLPQIAGFSEKFSIIKLQPNPTMLSG
jgi:hypothetical protein